MEVPDDAEFVEINQAIRLHGVSGPTFRRHLRRFGGAIYLDPGDNRRRLVKRSDVEALRVPRPVARARQDAAADAA